jgi:hypothetical protein
MLVSAVELSVRSSPETCQISLLVTSVALMNQIQASSSNIAPGVPSGTSVGVVVEAVLRMKAW